MTIHIPFNTLMLSVCIPLGLVFGVLLVRLLIRELWPARPSYRPKPQPQPKAKPQLRSVPARYRLSARYSWER